MRRIPAYALLWLPCVSLAFETAQIPPVREVPNVAPVFGSPPLTVELAPLLDTLWKRGMRFQAGGATGRISGLKASNGKKDWFLTVCEDVCAEPRFIGGKTIVRYRLGFPPVKVLDGSADVIVGGRPLTVYIQGQLVNKADSKLRVEPADGKAPRLEWRVREIADRVYDGGWPLLIGGRSFRLLYTRDILEDAQGNFAGFGTDRSIVFMTRSGEDYLGYGVKESDLSAQPRLFVKAPAGEDLKTSHPLRVILGLSGGVLSVSSPEPQVAER